MLTPSSGLYPTSGDVYPDPSVSTTPPARLLVVAAESRTLTVEAQ